MLRVRQSGFLPTNKKVSVTKSRVAGFLNFGPDNLFPQTLLDVIDDSDTASAAMSVRAEFIEGNGLFDVKLSELIVNRKGQTLDDIMAATAWNVSTGEVACLHVGYNGMAEINSIQSVPWEQVRFQEPDDLGNIVRAGIFPYLGSTLYPKRKDEHKLVYLFDPRPDVIYAQMEASGGIERYYGQLLYIPAGRSNGSVYHVPSYAGGSISFETEKELATYRYRTITSDMVAPGMLKGLKPNRGGTKTEGEDDRDSLANRVTHHQGAENSGAIMTVEVDTIEELENLSYETFAGSDLANRYNSLTEQTEASISRRTRVPAELMGIRKSSSGISFTQIQIKLFSQLMQQTVNRYQRTVERTLDRIFDHWHEPIELTDRGFSTQNLDYFKPQPGEIIAAGLE